ncbi:MAG: sulfocyanin-like copper-binding protein, partial [Alphaproteobacteria bacterium]|nr:sulfocyanin-like copper-binding protein [Alphaproteobacteria bacterium]
MTEPAKTYRRPRARPHSWHRLALAALVAPLMAWPPATAHAGEKIHPSWMEADASRKKVKFMLVSGWNANNGALNYNGYFEGGMTIVVPVGWRVEITLRNQDGNY